MINCFFLDLVAQVSFAVDDTAHFHDIANHYIENGIVVQVDAIIRMFTISPGGIGLEDLSVGAVLANGGLYCIQHPQSGILITQFCRRVSENQLLVKLVQIN